MFNTIFYWANLPQICRNRRSTTPRNATTWGRASSACCAVKRTTKAHPPEAGPDGMGWWEGVLAMPVYDVPCRLLILFSCPFWCLKCHFEAQISTYFGWSFHIVGCDLRWCFCTFKESVIFSAGYCLDSNTNPNRLVEWTRPSCRQFRFDVDVNIDVVICRDDIVIFNLFEKTAVLDDTYYFFGISIIRSHQFRCHDCLPRMFGLKTCISHHISPWAFFGDIDIERRMVCPDPVPMPRGYWRSNARSLGQRHRRGRGWFSARCLRSLASWNAFGAEDVEIFWDMLRFENGKILWNKIWIKS